MEQSDGRKGVEARNPHLMPNKERKARVTGKMARGEEEKDSSPLTGKDK